MICPHCKKEITPEKEGLDSFIKPCQKKAKSFAIIGFVLAILSVVTMAVVFSAALIFDIQAYKGTIESSIYDSAGLSTLICWLPFFVMFASLILTFLSSLHSETKIRLNTASRLILLFEIIILVVLAVAVNFFLTTEVLDSIKI